MVSLQGDKPGLALAGLGLFAGTNAKSNDLLDRDITAGMNAKQLGLGGVTMAKSDDAVSWIKANGPSQVGNLSNDAVKIGAGFLTSAAGNRMGNRGVASPVSTALLLDGIGGVANSMMNGGGTSAVQAAPTAEPQSVQTESLHRGGGGTASDVVDY